MITITGIIKEIVECTTGGYISYFMLETTKKELFKVKCFGIGIKSWKVGNKVIVRGILEYSDNTYSVLKNNTINDSSHITQKPLIQKELTDFKTIRIQTIGEAPVERCDRCGVRTNHLSDYFEMICQDCRRKYYP